MNVKPGCDFFQRTHPSCMPGTACPTVKARQPEPAVAAVLTFRPGGESLQRRIRVTRLFLWLSLFAFVAPGLAGQAQAPRLNKEARDFKVFTGRVQEYVKMQKNQEASPPALKPAKDAAQTAVNPDAALVQEFERRVADYVKLHKSAEATLPPLKSTGSQEKIRHHQHELREAILAQRAEAVQGNIFTPQIGSEFRRLIGIAYQGEDQHIRDSLKRSEPVKLRFRVNKEYPDDQPLQTMPSSLLLNLPQLPPEVEYRLVGRDLVLRDVGANLIVDFLRRAIPR